MASFSLLGDGNIIRLFLAVVFFILPSCASLAVDSSLRLGAVNDDSTYPSSPDLSRDIFARVASSDSDSSSCYSDEFFQCGSQVPDNMCCGTGTSCMVLASNTTIVCCPEGQTCSRIHTITCNTAQQDSKKHPTSPIQTIALDKEMKKCGNQCCPFGYICNEDENVCDLDSNQDHYDYLMSDSTTDLPSTTTSPSTFTSTSNSASQITTGTGDIPTLLASTVVTSTGAAETSSSASDTETNDTASSPTGLIAACSVGGVCCAAAVGILIWLQWFRKKLAGNSNPTTPSQQTNQYFGTPGSFGTPASFGTPSSTRYLLARGPDDKFRMTPSTSTFEPPPPPTRRAMSESPLSPIELPATPVSMSGWIEGAEVEEPRLAYVLPPRKIA
ncbi:hypothetical protein B0T10DRAFT_458059 [Thelonectria olida]|uniref:Uncharacterized protein n=1 Tax=Thelonectria olida TaxID=1576542 RepID=A0A9P8W7C1_9HYPO|nr:hypothetical protein B0T10DRAFT_458059 [Thelonectria olida]